MKRSTALLCLLVAFSFLASCANTLRGATGSESLGAGQKPLPIVEEDLRLGELAVGNTTVRVLALLGEPIRRINRSEPAEPGGEEGAFLYRETWMYPGMQVTFMNVGNATTRPPDIGRVWAITATAAGLSTPRGLKIGDSLKKVVRAYGTIYTMQEKFGAKVIEFGEIYSVSVRIRNGIVREITVEQHYE